jgi:uncharacterized coiled-coil protein SlyX
VRQFLESLGLAFLQDVRGLQRQVRELSVEVIEKQGLVAEQRVLIERLEARVKELEEQRNVFVRRFIS